MIKKTALFFALAIAFGFGFAFNSIFIKSSEKQEKMKRVTGIGGIFFKCQDPGKMRDWYKNHLGLNVQPWGTKFEWREESDSTKQGYTVWAPFPEKTKHFEPSTKDFMINYRVENIEALIAALKTESVTVLDTIENTEYGKFVHILDIEGNKIELFEPVSK
jgi:predicted enzyme related to lactoylglutathione lyase